MDYYNFDSEVIESLNLLRPPVKRDSEFANRDFSVYCSSNKQNLKFLKDFGHKFRSKCRNNKNDIPNKNDIQNKNNIQQPSPKKHGGSSTSLILKRTSESQILKQYSVIYTGLNCQGPPAYTKSKTAVSKDKPLIKVTVIPKSEQNTGSRLFRKQRIITKTIQATTSNCENSIHTKNVYLVVAGRKKDKVYEIKTTGSVNFEKENTEDEALEHLSHFKEFIKSLNMERKKKKNKKRDAKKNETQINLCETTRNIDHMCKCTPSPTGSNGSVRDVRPGRSRVRIFGKIGLNADDNYYMKCQATVDDKPVLSCLPSALKKKSSTCSVVVCSKNVETSTNRRSSGFASGREQQYENNTREEPGRYRRSSVLSEREEFENSRQERYGMPNTAARMREEVDLEENNTLWRNTGVLCLRGDSDQDVQQQTMNEEACEDESDEDDIEGPLRDIKDVVMQTEVRSNALNELLINIQKKNSTRISNQSQATQVNFSKIDEACKVDPYSAIQPIGRCNCSSQGGPFMETIDNSKRCSETLKPCQSPLVIISVYPKQGQNKPDVVQTIQCAHLKNQPLLIRYPEAKADSIAELTVNKTTDIDPWFRTSSPNGAKTKLKSNKYVETRHSKSNSRNEIPKQSKNNARKVTSPLKQEVINKPKRKPSPPRSPRSKSPPPSREQQNKNASRQSLKPKSKKPKKVDASMNTEHQKTKKALVDSYTNKITEQIVNGNKGPPKNLSTVSINIDSEHEFYDVTFRHDDVNTDLNLRRTMKEAYVQNVYNETADTHKNYLPRTSKSLKLNKLKKTTDENPTDDLKKNTPILTVRDSLEIGHRREGKVIRDTQTHRPDNQPCLNTSDREFLAPIKHYTGDNCTICDPLERDREIRELLGVEERRTQSQFNNSQDRFVALENILSRRCFYKKQCNNTYVTAFALSQHHTPCTCTVENKCKDTECDFKDSDDDDNEDDDIISKKSKQKVKPKVRKQSEVKEVASKDKEVASKEVDAKEKPPTRNLFGTDRKSSSKHRVKPEKKTKDASCGCMLVSDDSCPCPTSDQICDVPTCKMSNSQIESNEINKDRQVEAKPIDDKKEIDTTQYMTRHKQDAPKKLTKHVAKKSNVSDQNVPSSLYQQLTLNRNIQIFLQVEQFSKEKPIVLNKKQYNKIKKTIQRTILEKGKRCVCTRSGGSIDPKNELAKKYSSKDAKSAKSKLSKNSKKSYSKNSEKKHVDTVVLFSNEARGSFHEAKPLKVVVQRAKSSLEVRGSSVSYWKNVTLSSTNIGSIASSSIANRNQHSLETIFRGHKKSLTPNLGASAFSLPSEARISESQSMKISPDPKAKKPFLKRLMSCLVLRTRVSDRNPSAVKERVANSSVDDYQFGSSFGAIEMTSSIYDTSVSFYSDHSIHPLSSKFKRSFLSLVKGFLTSKKS